MTHEYDPERDSLTDILKACGYTHRRCAASIGTHQSRDVYNAVGDRVFTGTYGATLEWLKESGQAREQEAPK